MAGPAFVSSLVAGRNTGATEMTQANASVGASQLSCGSSGTVSIVALVARSGTADTASAAIDYVRVGGIDLTASEAIRTLGGFSTGTMRAFAGHGLSLSGSQNWAVGQNAGDAWGWEVHFLVFDGDSTITYSAQADVLVNSGATHTKSITGSADSTIVEAFFTTYNTTTFTGQSGATVVQSNAFVLGDGVGVYGPGSTGSVSSSPNATEIIIGGAWNLEAAGGDTTPPTLSSPTGTGGALTGSGTVSTANDANGTLWYRADTSTTATDPGAGSEAGAGWSSQPVTAEGTQTVSSFGALTAGTNYAHYLHVDAAGNRSSVANSAGFTVSAANNAPVWSGTPSAMSSKRGQALTPQDITSLVSDADLDTLAYSITGAPAGVTIGSSSGIVSGTPTAAPGVYACTVEASDGIASPVSSASFNITVQQCVLALDAEAYAFGDGNSAATMARVASTELQVAAYPLTEWPPASAIASATATTGTNGRLADLGDDDLSFGTTYRVLARNAATGETWAWTMTAS